MCDRNRKHSVMSHCYYYGKILWPFSSPSMKWNEVSHNSSVFQAKLKCTSIQISHMLLGSTIPKIQDVIRNIYLPSIKLTVSP